MDAKDEKMGAPVSARGITDILGGSFDFEKRPVTLGGGRITATLCFIDGLVAGIQVSEDVIRPLTDDDRFSCVRTENEAVDLALNGGVYGFTARRRDVAGEVINDLLNGFCALIFEREKTAVTFETRMPDKRAIDQPKEEKVVKGAKDAFNEILKTNTMLVRRKLKNPDLRFKKCVVGSKTQTDAVIAYIEGFTNPALLNEVVSRMENIQTEGALASAVIEENLVDDPNSPFPQIITTERPDKFCMNLLEGRVGIIVDGLPIGYLVPGTVSQFLKVPEDHSNHFIIASMLTVLRCLSAVVTVVLPAFYVAVAMYHQEMLPMKLIQSIIDAKQSVPFPTAIEVIAMLISFELVQEAGLRLPNPIGQTVSIIGALIVGQSAVEAKVVSPVVVVVVALSGICGYTMPNQDFGGALRVCRFALVLTSIFAGMFGLVAGATVLVYHLCSLESFGVSYMSPFAGTAGNHRLRALLRAPMTKKKDREPELGPISE